MMFKRNKQSDVSEFIDAVKAEVETAHSAAPELETLLSEIRAGLSHARAKFPGKNVTFAAMIEEVGEVATAIFEEPRANVRKEAVQLAVMACRLVLDGDHTYEPWRAMQGLDPLIDGARE